MGVEIFNHGAERGAVAPRLEVSNESTVAFGDDPEHRGGPDSQKLGMSRVDGVCERKIVAHYRRVILMIPVNWTVQPAQRDSVEVITLDPAVGLEMG